MILNKKTLCSTGFSEKKIQFYTRPLHLKYLCSVLKCIDLIFRLRQRRFSTYFSSPTSDDVVHERGHLIQNRTTATQPVTLSAQETTPNHLHRRATGGTGEPFPRNQIPWCWHTRAIGTKGAPTRRESRGEWNQFIDHTVNDRVHAILYLQKDGWSS